MKKNKTTQEAILAGGCFWCIEAAFKELPGVIDVESGYIGGYTDNPKYKDVCQGDTGHVEAVKVTFDPEEISYKELLNHFWKQIDPTDSGGQFADRGSQYITVIFYTNNEQKKTAEQSRLELEKSGKFGDRVVTRIVEAGNFFKAEESHQNYYKKMSFRYNAYKKSSGRDQFLKDTWS